MDKATPKPRVFSLETEKLNTLKSIDSTLKRIEQILSEPKPDYENMKLPSAFVR